MKGAANTSPMAKAIITALSLDAELERNSIASRLNSGKENIKKRRAQKMDYTPARERQIRISTLNAQGG